MIKIEVEILTLLHIFHFSHARLDNISDSNHQSWLEKIGVSNHQSSVNNII